MVFQIQCAQEAGSMNVGCGDNVLQSGHISEEANVLEGTSKSCLRYLVALEPSEIETFESDLARSDRVNAGNNVEDCGFTSTVRSDESTDFAAINVEIHFIKSSDTTELNGDILEIREVSLTLDCPLLCDFFAFLSWQESIRTHIHHDDQN
jgi:hypothetical protein